MPTCKICGAHAKNPKYFNTTGHKKTKRHQDALKRQEEVPVTSKTVAPFEVQQLFPQVEVSKGAPKVLTLEREMKTLEPLIMQLITPRFDALEKRILDIENIIKLNKVEISPSTKPFIPTMNEFALHLKKQWQELDRIYRWGGRVEIPLLRRRMKNIPRDTFDNYLLELEKEGVIDLQVASDTSLISRSQDGIKHPIRGLIYYLIFRN